MARAPLLAAAVALALLVVALGSAPAYAAAEQDDLKLRQAPVTRGLSLDLYKRSCPKAESIVRDFVRKDVGLLVLHFHDCFVQMQGCDASVLLDGSATEPGEQQPPPNLTLRPSAFKAINDIRDRLERECRRAVVSCSYILALAARASVVATGGPQYRVPLGRRDGARFATPDVVCSGLPRPSSDVHFLLEVFHNLSLDATDLVALSGGHTIGLGHCSSFKNQLYPSPDPNMSPPFLASLKQTCPAKGTDATIALDVRTPDVFDNKYFVNLMKREGHLVPDQDLLTNDATRHIVERFAGTQRDFFDQFSVSMVKMGQIKVLTGDQGQVRRNCAVRNPGTADGLWQSSLVKTMIDATAETLGFLDLQYWIDNS